MCGRHPIGAVSPGLEAWLTAVDTDVSDVSIVVDVNGFNGLQTREEVLCSHNTEDTKGFLSVIPMKNGLLPCGSFMLS